MIFSELLKALRSERQLTLQKLSENSGVDTGTISRIENDKADATLLVAIRLCKVFGIDSCMVLNLKRITKIQELSSYMCKYERIDEVVTQYDVDIFIKLFHHNPERGRDILAKSLEQIAIFITSSEASDYNSLSMLSQKDIYKLLNNSPLYHFDIKYPSAISVSAILEIYRKGGFIIPEDVTVVAAKKRKEMEVRKRIGRYIDNILSRLESGAVERVLLSDVITLDEALDQQGNFLGMCWKAYTLPEYTPSINLQAQHEAEQETMLRTLFVKICRWLTVVNKNNYLWLEELRREMKEDITLA